MSLKFKKFVDPDGSEGIRSKWAGVTIRSSASFWYIRQRKFDETFEEEAVLYWTELPTKLA
jgi:hypothetical protein